MTLSAEDLNQIKSMFDASVLELVEREDFCRKIAKLASDEVSTLKDNNAKLEQENQSLRQIIDDIEQYGKAEETNENVENAVLKDDSVSHRVSLMRGVRRRDG